ncbi:diguanylate cyclase domain-containing protein [Arhodomonas sp. AD133]|uniref:diguanylate cyclase domain-containing protein n=1 Tax=Arhodomonas sp. AD133 TaxID=3415009 RepID=UPI003EB85102
MELIRRFFDTGMRRTSSLRRWARNLGEHRAWLLALLGFALGLVALNAYFGDVKPAADWDWIDIVGEGATVVFVVIWLVLILSVRPKGPVTALFATGLIGITVACLQDVLDEVYELADGVVWDSLIESLPVGLLLLTAAIAAWCREQRMINRFMDKRERLFRSHGELDGCLPVAKLPYFKQRLAALHRNAPATWARAAVVMLEVEQYNEVSHRYGGRQADRMLLTATELILLNLDSDDLLCRYAGGRFVILLLGVSDAEAQRFAERLAAFFSNYQYTAPGMPRTPLGLAVGVASVGASDAARSHTTAGSAVFSPDDLLRRAAAMLAARRRYTSKTAAG